MRITKRHYLSDGDDGTQLLRSEEICVGLLSSSAFVTFCNTVDQLQDLSCLNNLTESYQGLSSLSNNQRQSEL